MSRAATNTLQSGRGNSSGLTGSKQFLIPLLACAFACIGSQITGLLITGPYPSLEDMMRPRLDTRIFWPALAATSIFIAFRHRNRLIFPPHIICLFILLAFAGMSALWAFSPRIAFTRFSQQAMVISSLVLPLLVANQRGDLIRGIFYIFSFAAIANIVFLFYDSPIIIAEQKGYSGYFPGKNYLGEFAVVPLLLSLHQLLYSWRRRVLGLIFAPISVVLLYYANSKTAMGLAFFMPVIAGITLIFRRKYSVSPAIFVLTLLFGFILLSYILNFDVYKISYKLYGDSTFTGRRYIWEFVNLEIWRRPILGWGYQSFWLAGPDAPSITDAVGWVKTMPYGHNGYLDMKLELGHVGFALLVIFILMTLHASGKLADHDFRRAWIVLSLMYYVIFYNFLESIWMRGFEFLWVIFVLMAAEIARCNRPVLSFPPVLREPIRHRQRPGERSPQLMRY